MCYMHIQNFLILSSWKMLNYMYLCTYTLFCAFPFLELLQSTPSNHL